ncbi:hypothetical protein C1646_764947 [Rhizophagus diaphanus]|nr:hypothetical protein C1646_764947 [Rhizophagus diaphanus] [Rhizophagus sp. MUCL 43196]
MLANWLLHVANNENFEYQENIFTAILPQISPFFNVKNKSTMVSQPDISNTLDKPLYSNHSAPSYFILKTVMKLNQIPIEFQEEELNKLKYKEIGRKMRQKHINLPNVLASLCRRPKLLSSLHDLLTKCSIIGHTNRHKRRLEKIRIKSADPSKCLLTEKNVFNLAMIDNIDFKERSFQFGNIYDITRGTSHATLRMYNERQELEYNKIDLTAINSEILRQTEFGCNLPPPNVVILKPSGFPNDDNEILHTTEMYRRDFSLEKNDFLDICVDVAIFRRLIKCRNKSENIQPNLGQWHTSKNMMSALVTLFSSYGIYDLATALGVKFLDKFDKFAAVIDYRSTRRVLELIWVAVGAAINIYLQKSKIKIEEILSCPANEKICLRIWYLYYEWFAIWKTHLIEIRCGNYELQKFELAAFAPLFPVAGKSNYTTSITHFLANLEKYPLLEKKLRLYASINLAREGHYPAFDEALETHGVAYIKQNITGNSYNQKKLRVTN